MRKHYRSTRWTYNSLTGEKKAKMAFPTLDAAIEFNKNNKLGCQPYVCDVCGNWHLGHYREK